MKSENSKIKFRYWIIFIYLFIVFIGFLILRHYILKQSQSIFRDNNIVLSILGTIWLIFYRFGSYFFISMIIPIVGYLVSKRLKKYELKIAFRFLSYFMIAFFVIFVLYCYK